MGKIDSSHVPSRSDRSLGRYPRILLSMGHRILTMKLTHGVPVHLSLDQQPFISYGMPAKTNVGSGTKRICMNMFGFPCLFRTQVSRMGGKKQKKMCDLTISILVLPPQFAQIWWVIVCQRDVVFVLVAYQFFPAFTCWPTCGKNHTCSKCCEQKKGGLQHPELQPLNCQIAMFASLALYGSVWTLGDRNIDGEFIVDGKVLCFFPCQIILFLPLFSMVFW